VFPQVAAHRGLTLEPLATSKDTDMQIEVELGYCVWHVRSRI
jgi:hypothetical protein